MTAITKRLITLDALAPLDIDLRPLGAHGAIISAHASLLSAALDIYEYDPDTSDKHQICKAQVTDAAGNQLAPRIHVPLTLGALNLLPLISVPQRVHITLLDEPPTPKGSWVILYSQDILAPGTFKSYDLDLTIASGWTYLIHATNGIDVDIIMGPAAGPFTAFPSAISIPIGTNATLRAHETAYHRYLSLNLHNTDPANPTTIDLYVHARLDLPLN